MEPTYAILDDLVQIREIDKSNYSRLLKNFADQCKEGMEIGNRVTLASYTPIQSILLNGMGGSAIAGELLRNYLFMDVNVPMMTHQGFSIPAYVNKSTLMIASSYSGNTEETLHAYNLARKKQAQIICIASGGELLKRAEKDGYAHIVVPSGLPSNMSVGYIFFSLLMVFHRLDLISDKLSDAHEGIEVIRQLQQSYTEEVPVVENTAKKLAIKLQNKLPIIYTSRDEFNSVAYRWKKQFSGNAKLLTMTNSIPNLTHHEISGWSDQNPLKRNTEVILIRDKDDETPLQKRVEITRDILRSHTGGITEIWTAGRTLLARIWSVVYLGDYLSYYLAILNQIDPLSNELLQEFKNKLTGNP